MKIVKLEAENVKRLRAVSISPDGNMVVIGGRNGQGKSSTLDAIEMALGGAGAIPPEPIRRGAKSARIVADLGDIVVERTFSAKGGTQLKVRSADGVEQRSPQSLLDSLCSRVAFDPLDFARMEPKKQTELLRKLVGIDFSALDQEREQVFAERTQVNRRAKDLRARVDGMPQHSDVPEREVSVEALVAELDRRQAQESTYESIQREIETSFRTISELEQEIGRLENLLSQKRHALESAVQANEQQKIERDLFVLESSDEVRAKLRDAERINRMVRENAARVAQVHELRRVDVATAELTRKLEDIDAKKEQLLAEAKFPVDGLGFDESGVTLAGIPLSQASQAELMRVSVAIGLALHPKLKVLLVRDGSLLDVDSMRMLSEMAAAHDAQVWIERVGKGDPTAIVIEDGEVEHRSDEEAAQ